MEDTESQLLKYAAIAGGLFLVWKNWNTIGPYLGFAPSFSDTASLQAYCQANPAKQATLLPSDQHTGGTFVGSAWLDALGVKPTANQPAQQQSEGMGAAAKEEKWEPPKPWSPAPPKESVN